MKRIGLLVLVGVWAVLGFAQECVKDSVQMDVQMDLRQAFEQVAALEGFEALSQSDVEGITGFQLGKCEGTVHGNASHRDEVLQIFSALPADALYSEEVTSKNKITRFYITTDLQGKSSMLYSFVGLGGNDLLVILYEDGDLKKYQEIADKIK